MATFKINLPYKIKGNEEEIICHQQVTYNYIIVGVHSKYPNGIEPTYRRSLGRILQKIDNATEQKADTIEVEQAEIDLLKTIVREAKYPSAMALNANILEEEIEKLK